MTKLRDKTVGKAKEIASEIVGDEAVAEERKQQKKKEEGQANDRKPLGPFETLRNLT